jgi:NADPH:quinone reductase-like Zn-dependent oxidoreductase
MLAALHPSFDKAATIPLGLATAAIRLYQKKSKRGGADLVAPWKVGELEKYAGQAIYVTGGANSVGQNGMHFCIPRARI